MKRKQRIVALVNSLSVAIAAMSLSLTGCAKPAKIHSEMEPCPEISPMTWEEIVEILGEMDEDGGYKWDLFPLWLSDVMRYCEEDLSGEP